jgi:hypothetical protein
MTTSSSEFGKWQKVAVFVWHESATYVIQTAAIWDFVNNIILHNPLELMINHRIPV